MVVEDVVDGGSGGISSPYELVELLALRGGLKYFDEAASEEEKGEEERVAVLGLTDALPVTLVVEELAAVVTPGAPRGPPDAVRGLAMFVKDL